MTDKRIGKINSIQTLGTLDGPGVRFVAFLQGCPLRCGCCHNPETRDAIGKEEYTAERLVATAERYREYFGERGGVTLSGGEPLLQAEFATRVFELCLLTQRLFVPPVSDIQGSFLNIFFSKLCFTFVSMETSLEMLSKSRVIQQIFIFWKILLHFRKPVWGQKARRDSVSLRNHLLPVKRACGAELLP